MSSGLADGGLLLLSFSVPFICVLLGLTPFLRFLTRKGWTSEDVHKSPPTKVPEPAGPMLFVTALLGEMVVAIGFQSWVPVAISLGAGIAFMIGLADDMFVLGGKTKPLLLLLAGVAFAGMVAFIPDLYQPVITFPILGDT